MQKSIRLIVGGFQIKSAKLQKSKIFGPWKFSGNTTWIFSGPENFQGAQPFLAPGNIQDLNFSRTWKIPGLWKPLAIGQ